MMASASPIDLRNPNPSGLCWCGCGEMTQRATTDGWPHKGNHRRYLHGHQWRSDQPEYIEEDHGFSSSCWIWQRGKDARGYGAKVVDGRIVKAHRSYYESAKGPVAADLELDHLCGVPSCVNPDHLEAVSHAENCRRGKTVKLSAKTAQEIRSSPEESVEALAQRFGVSTFTIYHVRAGRIWI